VGTLGSWVFILGGAILLVLAPFNNDRPWVRWVQALTGVCGIAAGVFSLLGV
jgi:hypothetical protein